MEHNEGARRILVERFRQITELDYTVEHDSTANCKGELLIAAMCYIEQAVDPSHKTPIEWPWIPAAWNPSGDPIKDLVRAGAFIAAEIDRLKKEKENHPREKE